MHTHKLSLLQMEPDGNAKGNTEEMQATLLALGLAVEQRDSELGAHCQRLAYMAALMGASMAMDSDAVMALYHGGYLHDLGKIAIPDAILLKRGPLNDEEWALMRTHPERGEEICRNIKSLANVLPIIRSHHERWDGSGYPDGLKGTEIPLLARILQVADIYDALTITRPYRKPCPAHKALQILREETERGWRDPEIVRVFFDLHARSLSRLAGDGSQPSLVHLDFAVRRLFARPGGILQPAV